MLLFPEIRVKNRCRWPQIQIQNHGRCSDCCVHDNSQFLFYNFSFYNLFNTHMCVCVYTIYILYSIYYTCVLGFLLNIQYHESQIRKRMYRKIEKKTDRRHDGKNSTKCVMRLNKTWGYKIFLELEDWTARCV